MSPNIENIFKKCKNKNWLSILIFSFLKNVSERKNREKITFQKHGKNFPKVKKNMTSKIKRHL